MKCRQEIQLHLPACNLFYSFLLFSSLVGFIEQLIGILTKRGSSYYTSLTIYINIFGCYLFQSEQTESRSVFGKHSLWAACAQSNFSYDTASRSNI